jgi:PAS domain S-box-containing protein
MESMESPGDERVSFSEAFDHAPTGTALVEIHSRTEVLGRFLAVNRALCALGGYAREDLLAVNALSLIHPDDRAEAGRLLEWLRDGRVLSFYAEQRLLRGDGVSIWATVTASLVHRASGHPLVLAHFWDATERKRFEAANRAPVADIPADGRHTDV